MIHNLWNFVKKIKFFTALSDDDFIGYFECDLATVLMGNNNAKSSDPTAPKQRSVFSAVLNQGSPKNYSKNSINKRSNTGILIVTPVQMLSSEQNDEIEFKIEGKNLAKKDLFGKSGFYLVNFKYFQKNSKKSKKKQPRSIFFFLERNFR